MAKTTATSRPAAERPHLDRPTASLPVRSGVRAGTKVEWTTEELQLDIAHK